MSYSEKREISEKLGVFLTPRTVGYVRDFVAELERKTVPEMEGWIVQFRSGQRMKLVLEVYKNVAKLLFDANPLSIWNKIRMTHIQDFVKDVPDYHRYVIWR